jgi:hypothetical protein
MVAHGYATPRRNYPDTHKHRQDEQAGAEAPALFDTLAAPSQPGNCFSQHHTTSR